MSSRTVKSQAKETIEIVSDFDWCATTGVNEASLRQWSHGVKSHVYQALWEHGQFKDKSGRAIESVLDWIKEREPEADLPPRLQHVFSTAVNAPTVHREIRGKRTFSIKLVALPESWYRKLMKQVGQPNGTRPTPEPVEVAALPYPVTAVEYEDESPEPTESLGIVDLTIANQVAMSLLTTVVDIISSGSNNSQEAKQLREELEDAQTEIQKLKQMISSIQDSNVALLTERNGLRSRLQQTESNLSAALKGETAQAVNNEIAKRIDSLMRATPTQKGE